MREPITTTRTAELPGRTPDRPGPADVYGVAAHTVAVVAVVAVAVAIAVGTIALLLAGGHPDPPADGTPDAGALTGWGLPLAGILGRASAVGVVGCLLVGAVLVPARPDDQLSDLALHATTCAGRWAIAWSLLATVQLVLLASDVAGVPPTRLDPALMTAVASSVPGRAVSLVALVAAVLAGITPRVGTRRAVRTLLAVAVLGLLPTVLAGHASVGADDDVAVNALVVHVVAATLWTGGLAGLTLHLGRSPVVLCEAATRFSTMALWSYVALATSGVMVIAAELGTSTRAWASGYGALVVAKVVALVLLGILGHVHRRRTLPRLGRAGGHRAFVRLAGVELVLMGATTGLAAALSRTPVPTRGPTTISGHGAGHASLPLVVEPVSVTGLATTWRPNAVVLLVLALALAAYLRDTRVVRERGGSWPPVRTGAFVSGLVVAGMTLCSGVAVYAPAMVSVQVSQLLVTLLVVPMLLLLGAPVDLWRRAGHATSPTTPAGRAATAVQSPVTGATTTSLLLLGVYRTPLIEMSQRSPTVHLTVLALALVSGSVLLWPVLRTRASNRARAREEQRWCLVGVAVCLGMLAAQLRYGDRLLAGQWFLELRWSWVDPVADQRLAGIVMGTAAAAVLAVALLSTAIRRGRPTLNG